MLAKISTANMSREDWLAERRHSLGGSDMGAVLGLNRWSSPYSVWAEKTGRLPPKEDNEAMRQGRDLEEYVASRFTEKSGKQVQRMNYLLRNDEAPYLHANIDRRILGERSGLECKTASALNLKTYAGGECPDSYYVQCVTYLTVTGWERWYLAVLILGKGFQIYQITTVEDDAVPEWCESSVYVSQAEMDALKSGAKRFWEEYVLPDQPPPADGAEATGEAISTIYSEDGGGEVQLFGREAMLREYFDLAAQIKDLQRDMDAIKQTIQQDMGEASEASCTGYSVTWKSQSRTTFDAKQFAKDHPHMDLSAYFKTSKFRTFKIKEDKAG